MPYRVADRHAALPENVTAVHSPRMVSPEQISRSRSAFTIQCRRIPYTLAPRGPDAMHRPHPTPAPVPLSRTPGTSGPRTTRWLRPPPWRQCPGAKKPIDVPRSDAPPGAGSRLRALEGLHPTSPARRAAPRRRLSSVVISRMSSYPLRAHRHPLLYCIRSRVHEPAVWPRNVLYIRTSPCTHTAYPWCRLCINMLCSACKQVNVHHQAFEVRTPVLLAHVCARAADPLRATRGHPAAPRRPQKLPEPSKLYARSSSARNCRPTVVVDTRLSLLRIIGGDLVHPTALACPPSSTAAPNGSRPRGYRT